MALITNVNFQRPAGVGCFFFVFLSMVLNCSFTCLLLFFSFFFVSFYIGVYNLQLDYYSNNSD